MPNDLESFREHSHTLTGTPAGDIPLPNDNPLKEIIAGTGIYVDDTDPIRPTVSVVAAVYSGLVANGTTSATTSLLGYGVNVFATSTVSNHATKLPQPVLGQSVKIVNLGAEDLSVFPSNTGGQIYPLAVDADATVPATGIMYEFICVDDSQDGVWVSN